MIDALGFTFPELQSITSRDTWTREFEVSCISRGDER